MRKLSNKILFGFFSLGMLYLLSSFAELRIRGDYQGLDRGAISETIPLDVNYVIISELRQRIMVETSNEARFDVVSKAGDMLSKLDYSIQGDTLLINSLSNEDDVHVDLNLYMGKNFRGLKVIDASVNLQNIAQSRLNLDLAGGRIVINGDVVLEKLSINAYSEANFSAYGLEADTLVLNANGSSINVRSRINRLEGYMENESWLSIDGINEIAFSKDKSSSMRITD